MRIVVAYTAIVTGSLVVAACNQTPSSPWVSATARTESASASGVPSAVASATQANAVSQAVMVRGDKIDTFKGPLTIMPLNHASFFMSFAGKVIAVDPTTTSLKGAGLLPLADYVFVTDIHPDHLDRGALDAIAKKDTMYVGPPAVAALRPMTHALANGERLSLDSFSAEAVPMYNLKRGPEPGALFHDKGRGDGYVFTFGDKRVYVSGDTECTPEMRALKDVDVAFLCMNLPYTMPPDEAATCAEAFQPKVVYPYHYRGQDPKAFAAAVAGTGIDVRLRDWYAAP
jgi:L-ascorbate metabolism protein UlaG (beta-lactamase superfamily)